jgi:hypothetical protein
MTNLSNVLAANINEAIEHRAEAIVPAVRNGSVLVITQYFLAVVSIEFDLDREEFVATDIQEETEYCACGTLIECLELIAGDSRFSEE